jgi:hypothetical protein
MDEHSNPDSYPYQCLSADEAADLVGKYILIGLRYVDNLGVEVHSAQMHGIVSAASTKQVHVALRGERHGSTFLLPPDPRFFSAAKPGKYTLRSTGEVIENPQLLCTAVLVREETSGVGGV